jgi:acetyltransferase-like isoleucine patch superfamily enzyme
MEKFKTYIKSSPGLKQLVIKLLMVPNEARPRWWVKAFVNGFVHDISSKSIVRGKARLDVVPFQHFRLGAKSLVEEYACLNNGMGPILIGTNTTIGIGNTVIGPVEIGNNVIIGQYVTISGLNHGYENSSMPIRDQPCTTSIIYIENDCWIGSNSVIVAGVRIGQHSVVAAGSVVTRDVPPFSVVGGNPARLLRQYNEKTDSWDRM